MDARGILRKIDFYYIRNDFAAGKIDLVWNLSTFCDKKHFGIPNWILLREKRIFHRIRSPGLN